MAVRTSMSGFALWGMAGGSLAGTVDSWIGAGRHGTALAPASAVALTLVSAVALTVFGGVIGLFVGAAVRGVTARPARQRLRLWVRSIAFWCAAGAFLIALLATTAAFIRIRGIELDALDLRLPLLLLLTTITSLAGGLYLSPRPVVALRLGAALVVASLAALHLFSFSLGRYREVLPILLTRTAALEQVFGTLRQMHDADGDGFAAAVCESDCDCDDGNAAVNPAAIDIPGNGVDEDCSGRDFDGPPPPPPGEETDAPAGKAAAAARPGFRPPYNILLVTIDALRANHVGCYGYRRDTTPVLDRFATGAVRFHQVRSQGPSTRFVFPVLLTGRYFSAISLEKGAKWYRLLGENVTFAERLKGRGYRTVAILPYFRFKERSGFQQGFDVWTTRLPGTRDPTWEPTALPVTLEGLKHLNELSARPAPWFLWLHYFDPHGAYLAHPDQKQFGNRRVDLYDGEILHADRHLRMVLDGLRDRGLQKTTAVVVMSDHGEGHGREADHGIAYHGFSLYDIEIRIPLVIRLPGAAPRVVGRSVGLIDLPPTMLELAGITGIGDLHGISLVPYLLGENPERPPLLSELPGDHRRLALIDYPHKLIWDLRLNRLSLFHLEDDPGEQRDLSEEKPHLLQRLQDVLREMRIEIEAGRDR